MGRMPLSEFVQKAGEACQLVCDVMALRDGKAFFQAVADNERKCKIAFYVGLYGNTDSQPTRLNTYNLFDRQIKKALNTSKE